MKILFIHQNFPGQFPHLAAELAKDPRNQVIAMGDAGEAGKRNTNIPGVKLVCYETPQGASESTHNYIRGLEAGIRRGQQVCRLAIDLQKQGFTPDIIYCHPAWGESLFIKEVFPQAKLINFFEFFYHSHGADLDFDPEFPVTLDDRARVGTKNAIQLLSLVHTDVGVSPTHWQRSVYPPEYHDKIRVIFDGVNTEEIVPNPDITMNTTDYGVLTKRDKIITFINRGFEPYRGIHTFIRALPEIFRKWPDVHIVMVGTDNVHYGRKPSQDTYRKKYLDEVRDKIDLSRVYFTGWVDRARLLSIMQISSVHVYLTYPFVLSWSMLEAMSTECLVVGSRTAPVEEVIEDGKNGLLVDFFRPDELAAAVDRVLSHPDRMQALRQAARETVIRRYDLKSVCLPKQIELIHGVLRDSRSPTDG